MQNNETDTRILNVMGKKTKRMSPKSTNHSGGRFILGGKVR